MSPSSLKRKRKPSIVMSPSPMSKTSRGKHKIMLSSSTRKRKNTQVATPIPNETSSKKRRMSSYLIQVIKEVQIDDNTESDTYKSILLELKEMIAGSPEHRQHQPRTSKILTKRSRCLDLITSMTRSTSGKFLTCLK